MEHYTNTTTPDHPIVSAAEFSALTYAAEAVQAAPDQRIDPVQKARTRELGHVAQAYLALEPGDVAEGLTLYVNPKQAHDVAQAALFFTGTSRSNEMRIREELPADTRRAVHAFSAQVYTPMGTLK